MAFSLGDLLLLLDRTLLNPWLSAAAAAAAHALTPDNKFVVLSSPGLIPYRLAPLTPLLRRIGYLFAAGLALRVNRALSVRALNNGVKAKFSWKNEIIVVTGGSGGIGAATVQKLASKGSQVIVIDVLDLSFSKPENVHYYKCDLTDFSALQAVGSQIRKDVGEPTCVVANAGLCRGKTIFDATPRDIELTFGVNNLGVLWTAKTFLPSMAAKNHGHFLIVASQSGYLATAGVIDYAATKSAAVAIYEGLQTELKHNYNAPAVRVSCISPSSVDTKMFTGINSPSNFIMPRLTPTVVADAIANILWSGNAQNVMIPAFAYISAPTRCLPEWMRVEMQDGGADIMTNLKPHDPLAKK